MAALTTAQYGAILRGIGAPVTAQNIKAFAAWQRAEGGSARFNPFNTTQPMSGATAYNHLSGGGSVKNYASASQGIRATIETLKNGNYGNVIAALRKGNSAISVASAVGSSPWGTSGELFASVLGSHLPPAPAPRGGGPAAANPKQPGSHIDAGTFKNAAASILLQNSIAMAQPTKPGEPPPTGPSMLEQLVAAKTASVAQNGGQQQHQGGGPGATPGGAPTKAAPWHSVPGWAKIIGTPHSGTHTLGNWESDNAIDIAMPYGTPLRAARAGVIGSQIGALDSSNPRMAGLRLHLVSGGQEYYYAHLSKLLVHAGQHVKAGQIIGYSGAANGVNHLHIGTRNGNPGAGLRGLVL